MAWDANDQKVQRYHVIPCDLAIIFFCGVYDVLSKMVPSYHKEMAKHI